MKQTSNDAITVGNVVRLPEVRRMTGLGRSTIYRLQADHHFPQRIKLGIRAVGWLEHEVQEWLANRIARSREESSRL
jgi:prophage regulatory protein